MPAELAAHACHGFLPIFWFLSSTPSLLLQHCPNTPESSQLMTKQGSGVISNRSRLWLSNLINSRAISISRSNCPSHAMFACSPVRHQQDQGVPTHASGHEEPLSLWLRSFDGCSCRSWINPHINPLTTGRLLPAQCNHSEVLEVAGPRWKRKSDHIAHASLSSEVMCLRADSLTIVGRGNGWTQNSISFHRCVRDCATSPPIWSLWYPHSISFRVMHRGVIESILPLSNDACYFITISELPVVSAHLIAKSSVHPAHDVSWASLLLRLCYCRLFGSIPPLTPPRKAIYPPITTFSDGQTPTAVTRDWNFKVYMAASNSYCRSSRVQKPSYANDSSSFISTYGKFAWRSTTRGTDLACTELAHLGWFRSAGDNGEAQWMQKACGSFWKAQMIEGVVVGVWIQKNSNGRKKRDERLYPLQQGPITHRISLHLGRESLLHFILISFKCLPLIKPNRHLIIKLIFYSEWWGIWRQISKISKTYSRHK